MNSPLTKRVVTIRQIFLLGSSHFRVAVKSVGILRMCRGPLTPLPFGPNVHAAPLGTIGVAGPPHAKPRPTKALTFHTQTGDDQLVRLCSESVDVMNTLFVWGGDSGGCAYSKSNGAAGASALRVLGACIDVVTGAPKVSIAHSNGIAAALHQAQTCRMEAERTAAQLEASKALHASQLELLRADMTAYQSQCAAQLSAMHAQAAALEARHAEQLDAKDAQVAALEVRHAEQLGELRQSSRVVMRLCMTALASALWSCATM